MLELQKGNYQGLIRKLWVWSFRGLVLFILYIFAVSNNFLWLFGKMPSLQELENPKSQLASVLISEDGEILGKYFRENRSPIEFEELSPNIVNALIATEDARFAKHSGIDLRSTLRVITHLGTAGGGSTISQQLAKALFDTRRPDEPGEEESYKGFFGRIPGFRTLIFKTKEWILAIRLENRYTKQEIMKMYLNEVSFGNNTFGIQVAAKTYFGKDASKVSVNEAALLVGMLQNPNLHDPVRHPEGAKNRRNTVLLQMATYGYLPEEDKVVLQEKPLNLNFKIENQNTGSAPYLRESVKNSIQEAIKEINSSRDEEDKINLYTSGLKIFTTIDSRMQQYAESSINNHMKEEQKKFYAHWKGRNPWIDENNREIKGFIDNVAKRTARYKNLKEQFGDNEDSIKIEMNRKVRMSVFSWSGDIDTLMSPIDSIKYYKRILNCGFMSMDPNNGHVKAWVGGINFKYFKYDHVRQSKRQPGSTFKPYVYACAIDNDLHTPCDYIVDEPTTFGTEDGLLKPWTPQNSEGHFSYEPMSLRRAMGRSVNSVAAKLMKELGPAKIAEFAHKVGIQSALNETPALCLGASEVSVFEQVASYSTFVNGGIRYEPIMITKIVDKNGNVLKEFFPSYKEVISKNTAYLMTHMLKGAIQEPGGTAEGLKRYSCAKDNEIGAKTGTTSNYSDGWFMGITQNLVTGVWVGGDDRSIHFRTLALGQGAKMAMPAFANFMDKVYADPTLAAAGYRKGPFKKPENFSMSFDCGTAVGPDTIQVAPPPTQKPKENEDGFLK